MAELTTELVPYSNDVVTIVPVLGGEEPAVLGSDDLGFTKARLERLGVTGKAGELVRVLVAPNGAGTEEEAVVLLAGIGGERTVEALRRAAGTAARKLKEERAAIYDLAEATDEEREALLLGHLLGGYSFDLYRGTAAADDAEADADVTVRVAAADASETLLGRVSTVAGAVATARNLVNTPPSDLTPEDFANFAVEYFEDENVHVDVWDEHRLIEESCGGVLGVGAGSQNSPRIVHLSYAPDEAKTKVALVGKGITFDSGGLSIKPANSMVGMKFDMSGAAVVLATIRAIADLGLPVQVEGWCMLAENMPSGSAIKPDDVLRMRSGATVEVTNTDAEGRLVLADGLTLASEQQPDVIVDIATLTGAAMVALGDRTTGVVANNDEWSERLLTSASTSGEPMWRMPIPEEIREKLKSNVADMINSKTNYRSGGMLFAAAFLERFIGEDARGEQLPWLHLDIAGPAEADSAYGYVSEGGTGIPVRSLIGMIEDVASK